jgi:nicotinamidase-related amidase
MVTVIDKNTALVLIDLQKGIVGLPLAQPIAPVLENSAKLVAAFREAQLPVVIVNVNPVGGTWTKVRTQSPIPQNNLTPEEAAAWLKNFVEITPEIVTEEQDIFITKRAWNAFWDTPLHEELKKKNITGIVLAGISTSIGVEGTARNATELGYNISFAEDALNDSSAAAHAHSIQNIFPRIGEIDTTDVIIKRLKHSHS